MKLKNAPQRKNQRRINALRRLEHGASGDSDLAETLRRKISDPSIARDTRKKKKRS